MDFWPNSTRDARVVTLGYLLNLHGNIALNLIEKWGTVAGKIADEEDSVGRAVLDVMPPEQVIDRAFTLADLAVAELERRAWIRAVPTGEEPA